MNIVLCYPVEPRHVAQIQAVAPEAELVDAGQERVAEEEERGGRDSGDGEGGDRPKRDFKPRGEGAGDRAKRAYKPRDGEGGDWPKRDYKPREGGDRPRGDLKPRGPGGPRSGPRPGGGRPGGGKPGGPRKPRS